MRNFGIILLGGLGILFIAGCGDAEFRGPVLGGYLHNEIRDCSGIAVSRTNSQVIWAHNDSGNTPILYAMKPNGMLLGRVRVEAKNVDWEDIAAFTMNGRNYLLVADTGDNTGKRRDCSLIVIEEPQQKDLSTTKDLDAKVAWRIPVRYADGEGRDCEAVAVDENERQIYLFTKRRNPVEVHTLPLKPDESVIENLRTRMIGVMEELPSPGLIQSLQPMASGRYRRYVTAADFSPDGRMAVLLTYGEVLLFNREKSESWMEALSRSPAVLPEHGLGQAEAAAISPDKKTIYVSGEGFDVGILQYRR